MKAPNHGRRVTVTDWFLNLGTGHLLYTPHECDGFLSGLSLRLPHGIERIVRGDRIRLIP